MTTLRPDPQAVSSKPETQRVTSQPEAGLAPSNSSRKQGLGKRPKLSIQTLVVTSFVVQIVAAVGLIGWLSLRNGQKAVNELSSQLRSEITARVEQRLNHYLGDPHLINEINIDGVRLGELDFQDITRLERHFWQQLQLFPSTSYIYVGTEQNIFSGAEQVPDGLPNVAYWTGASVDGGFETYETDEKGFRQNQLSRVPNYELFTRPWYTAGKESEGAVWGDIYVWAAPYPNVALPAVSPIYDSAGKLQAVFAVDLSLLAMGDFLQTLQVGETGQVFIMERDGLLVSTSTVDPLFTETNNQQKRLPASQSQSPLVQGAARFLKQNFGDLNVISSPQSLSFELDGKRQHLQVTPYQDEFGLDWLIVVAVPEADFMVQISANTRNTILLSGVALVSAIILGIITSHWITAPITRLSRASEAIAGGQLDQMVKVDGVGELRVLALSFNQMAQQLRQSFMALEATNEELERRVEQRTATLHEEGQMLQREVKHLLDVVSAVEDGDLTVEAQVSSHATGLVADTLNRLIERLGKIMATALNTAGLVNQGSEKLDQLSNAVADNAQKQAQSVAQVQTLMENVNNLSQDTAQQAMATDEAVQLTQAAINHGQQEITTMATGIGVLHKETDQIVKRVQTLTEYVELAARFAKDQKRTAAQTRVLAMNASMLATRAAGQQDPGQFAGITREFETIATQVNNLAVQTNQSLVLLQQRTDQIQTVVSGLNHDTQEISQQVHGFTIGVDQSREVFNNIKAVTERVAEMGRQVTESSQTIAQAAQNSLESIRDISEIAAETSNRANMTKEQSQQMDFLARTLLQNIDFFELQPGQPVAEDSVESPPPPPLLLEQEPQNGKPPSPASSDDL
ncbi:MAG: cache domain-containing protein [Leptolyngbyaceae cyanobacterium MO_188.B28]|nr:cache domain-containing protein [Leptolyngbyaceae cyanobacterium MO_188.B28]